MSQRIERRNPTHPSEVVGSVVVSSPAQVDEVVRAADQAQRTWAAVRVGERCAALAAAYDSVDARVDELAPLLAREMGKVLPDCVGEITYSGVWTRWVAAQAPEVLADDEVDDDAARLLIRQVPFGVVAAITPWNAPIILSMLKVAPAIAAGNAVVVKPSPLAPLAVTEVLITLAAALPAGLLSLVHGDTATGGALVGHELVRKVAFTGGNVTARAIGRTAAEVITPTVMELGGNDAAIFLPDADLSPAAMGRAVIASFATSGQVCMAAKRLYVPRSRLEEFVDGYVKAAHDVLVVGDPMVDGVTLGPVVDEAARDRLQSLLAASVAAGGQAVELGRVPDAEVVERGWFVRPTLVTGLADDAQLVAEEQFGPLLPVLGYEAEDEVVARANAGELGLGASVWSADEDHAFDVARRLEAGFTFVNTHNRSGLALRAPFGGVKRSGFGREYGHEGLREYTQSCVVNAPAAFRPGATATTGNAYPV